MRFCAGNSEEDRSPHKHPEIECLDAFGTSLLTLIMRSFIIAKELKDISFPYNENEVLTITMARHGYKATASTVH